MMPSLEYPTTNSEVAKASSTATAPPSPTFIVAPLRSRRKSAKAAAAFVAATVKEEILLPEYEPPRDSKRSDPRGNSQGSSSSTVPHNSHDKNSLHHATHTPCNSSTLTTPLRNCKGHPKKKTALSSFAVEYLKAWMMSPDHIEHPYPTEDEKVNIMKETHIELKQLTNWFVNNRKRYWKPKVEELRRQSLARGVTLQDLAAQVQQHMSPAMVAATVAGSTVKSSRAGNNNLNSPIMMTTVVSSEGEESLHSQPTKEQRSATVTQAPSLASFSKKRKKYVVAEDKVKGAHNLGGGRKTKTNLNNGPVANPVVLPPAPPTTKNQQQQSGMGFMAGGIHTANNYESVKAARKKSRTIIEKDRQNEGLPTSVLPVNMSPTLASTFNNRGAHNTQKHQKQQPDLLLLHRPISNDLLDYSISPLDNQVVSNTGATSKAVAASAVGFCCHVLPHGCNFAKSMGAKSCFASTCALCSACRDWNLGEFCPWDLTGIIGDISTDAEMVPASSSSSFSSSSSEMDGASRDNNGVFIALTKAISPDSNNHATTFVATNTSSSEGNPNEETITIARNLLTEVAGVASIDEGTNILCDHEYEEILKLPTAVPMMVGAVTAAPPSNTSFLIPAEASHSTLNDTVDFGSNMVDVKASWDLRKGSTKRAAPK